MTLDTLAQIGIALFGGASAFLVGRKSLRVRTAGFWIASCTQPLWFVTLIMNQQWLLLGLACWYTYCWISGLRNCYTSDPAPSPTPKAENEPYSPDNIPTATES